MGRESIRASWPNRAQRRAYLSIDEPLIKLLKLKGHKADLHEALRLFAAHVDDHHVTAAVESIIADARRAHFQGVRLDWRTADEKNGGGEGR